MVYASSFFSCVAQVMVTHQTMHVQTTLAKQFNFKEISIVKRLQLFR
jgi:hypothetical protein